MECSIAPKDPDFYLQYALQKINATEAWNITKGSESVVVGIIDSGIDGVHPDLSDNIWTNPNPNTYGYNNDIHGYDFVARNGGTPADLNGHGTHVSGIIGAKGNNSTGVSGTNWNVKLAWLGIGIGGSNSVSISAAIEALNYANLHDILITNNSYGGGRYSDLFKEAIENYRGLFVAAAGNYGLNIDNNAFYPAAYDLPNIISVAATDSSDQLAYFSNYGSTNVDIAAPGVDIYSTYNGPNYKNLNGTSMATPFVAGVAALLKSEHSDFTTAQLKSAILGSVDVLSQLNGKVSTGGRLNAYKALQNAGANIDVYFQKPSTWSTANAYYWAESGNTPVNWPGTSMTLISGNIYKATIPSNCNKIIFCDKGTKQTVNLTIPGSNQLYIPTANTWTAYNPDDVMTIYYQNDLNWTTPKAYYWENNGYFQPVEWSGTAMTHVKANIYKVDIPTLCDRVIFSNNGNSQTVDLTISGDGKIYRPTSEVWEDYNYITDTTATLYFTNVNNWTHPKAYLWNGSTTINNNWPGKNMTYLCNNEFGQSIYTVTYDSSLYDHVIFTNGAGQQTVNISIEPSQSSDPFANPTPDGNGYYLTGAKSNNKWVVGTYHYDR